MFRGVLIVGGTFVAVVIVIGAMVAVGIHELSAAQKQADDSWHKPEPVAVVAPLPPSSAAATVSPEPVVAADEQPAVVQIDSIDLECADAKLHGEVKLMDKPSKPVPVKLPANPEAAKKMEQRAIMRGNPDRSYLTGFSTPADYAEWPIVFPKPGTYEIDLTYACPKLQNAGQFMIKVGDDEISFTVDPTRAVNDFRMVAVGKVTLAARKATFILRPDPASIKRRCFLNVRGIQLIPVPAPVPAPNP